MCSPRDFEWIAIEPSRNASLISASGHRQKHYGEQAVPMRLRDGRKIWITFQVCDVNGPIMSVGKFCTKENVRCATFSTSGGTMWNEEAGEIVVDRVSKSLRAGMLYETQKRGCTSVRGRLRWKRT